MIKTKVAFVEGRILSSQSEQFLKYSKSSDWLVKCRPFKKPLLFWSCKQAKYEDYLLCLWASTLVVSLGKTLNGIASTFEWLDW